MLLERQAAHVEPDEIPTAKWVHADACELKLLEAAELETYDVVIAATGDDKVNLVLSLLATAEFGVGRVVARVNDPRNEWLFDKSWGSTSRCRHRRSWRRWWRRRCRSGTWCG